MDAPLRLEFSYTPKDMEEVQEQLLEKKMGRIGKCFWLAFLAGGVVLGGISMYFREDPANRLCMVAFVLVVVVVVLGVQWWLGKRTRPPTVVEIDPQDVRFTTDGSSQTIPWSALGALAETDKFFLLPVRKGNLSYILPKRAFPDEESCQWFRSLADAAAMVESSEPEPERMPPCSDPRSVTLGCRLCYRDYVDRAIASWFVRGLAAFFMGIVLVAFAAASLEPPEDAVFSAGQMFVFFTLPFMGVMGGVAVLVGATRSWFEHRRMIVDQRVTLSENGITETSGRGSSMTSWQTPTYFKETPWSFIVWWPSTSGWMLLPKRAFSTVDGVSRCREILEANAKRSTWYFGR